MTPISAIIITFNEARNIGRCLDSLQGIADEIIVLDSFSTDDTEAIARHYPVQFVQRAWEGYAASKNYANSLATNPCILSIDADECLSEELKASILNFKRQDEYKAARFNRLTNYCGTWIHHAGWYPDCKLRIFDRNKAHWTGDIHEVLSFKENQTTLHLKGDLLHYSYYTQEEHKRQMNKFSSIAANELFAKGKKIASFKPYLSSGFKFLKSFIFQLGFLHGKVGYDICRIGSMGSFLKYKKTIDLQQESN